MEDGAYRLPSFGLSPCPGGVTTLPSQPRCFGGGPLLRPFCSALLWQEEQDKHHTMSLLSATNEA